MFSETGDINNGLSAHRQTQRSESMISTSFTPFTWRI